MKKLLTLTISALLPCTLFAGEVTKEIIPVEVIEESPWEVTVIPYLWGLGIEGSTGYNGQVADMDIGFDDILDNLEMVAAGSIAVSYNRWGVLFDGSYLRMSTDVDVNGPLGLFKKADVTVTSGMASLMLTYKLIENENGYVMQGYAGPRLTYSKTEIRLQEDRAPSDLGASASETWVDGVVGLKGRIPFGSSKWFATYLADIGGGSSDLTWQAMATVGYQFSDGFDVRLGYRYLSTDYTKGNQEFVYDVDASGPILGLAFTW